MPIITRTVHNASSVTLNLFVPGYDTIKPTLTLAPSVTLDLFTVLTADELETIQNQLNAFVASGSMTIISTVDTATFNPVGGGVPDTLTSAHLFVGNVLNVPTDTAVSGDVTLSNTGVVTIANNAVTTAKINTAAITPAKISTTGTDAFVFPFTVTSSGTLTLATTNTSPLHLNFSVNSGAGTATIFCDSTGDLFLAPQTAHAVTTIEPMDSGQTTVFHATGSLTINSNAYQTSAVLQADDTTRGFLLPRMTTTQKNAIASPATGLMVYDTTLNKLGLWTGATWETVTSA